MIELDLDGFSGILIKNTEFDVYDVVINGTTIDDEGSSTRFDSDGDRRLAIKVSPWSLLSHVIDNKDIVEYLESEGYIVTVA